MSKVIRIPESKERMVKQFIENSKRYEASDIDFLSPSDETKLALPLTPWILSNPRKEDSKLPTCIISCLRDARMIRLSHASSDFTCTSR